MTSTEMRKTRLKRFSALMLGGSFAVIMAGGVVFAADEPDGGANDVDGSGIENIATVTGTYGPSNTAVTPNQAFENVDVIPAAPAVSLVKTIDTSTNAPSGPNGNYVTGDIIDYVFTVTNTGDSYLFDVSIADAFADAQGSLTTIAIDTGASTITATAPAGVGTSNDDGADSDYDQLAPDDIVVFTASYTVLASDMTAGSVDGDGEIDNSATASGTYVSDPTDAATDTTITSAASVATAELDIVPQLDVIKVSNASGPAVAGQIVTYTYTVTNTGTVAINGVTLADSHTSASGTVAVTPTLGALTDNGTAGDSSDGGTDNVYDTLAPSDVVTFTSTYTVTQEDIDQLQ